METGHIKKRFKEVYGTECKHLFFSPGRVNLIGEHTDYNGGLVLPCAINLGTYAYVTQGKDQTFRLFSDNFSEMVEIDAKNIGYRKENGWANYAAGMIYTLQKETGRLFGGMDIYITGSLPVGAGLSSSASLLVLIGEALNCSYSLGIEKEKLAAYAQKAEREFIGLNCGIMDHMSIALGKKGCAIKLDCASLQYEYVKLPISGYKIIIASTNKARELAASAYNTRHGQCVEAVKNLSAKLDISCLARLSPESFAKHKSLIHSDTARKRAEHVVYENERVKKAARCLAEGNIKAFGELMWESHESLQNLYEVSCFELDTMVRLASEACGVIGARMTGAGFGGCTVNIVEEASAAAFIEEVGSKYEKTAKLKADFYIIEPESGVKQVI